MHAWSKWYTVLSPGLTCLSPRWHSRARLQGEEQKKLDVLSNEVFVKALVSSGRTVMHSPTHPYTVPCFLHKKIINTSVLNLYIRMFRGKKNLRLRIEIGLACSAFLCLKRTRRPFSSTRNSVGSQWIQLTLCYSQLFVTNCFGPVVPQDQYYCRFRWLWHAPVPYLFRYCVCFDPLDGSSNIDCGVSIGTVCVIIALRFFPLLVACIVLVNESKEIRKQRMHWSILVPMKWIMFTFLTILYFTCKCRL